MSKQDVKIAIVTGTLSMGGAELVILNLGRSLGQLGYDVTIVTTSMPGDWFEQIEKNGIRALHIDGRLQVHPYRHAWRVGRRLKEENFNVVILTKFTNSERFSQAALNMLPEHVIAIPWIHSNTCDTYRTALTNRKAWNVAVAVGVRVAANATQKSKNKHILHIPNGLNHHRLSYCKVAARLPNAPSVSAIWGEWSRYQRAFLISQQFLIFASKNILKLPWILLVMVRTKRKLFDASKGLA